MQIAPVRYAPRRDIFIVYANMSKLQKMHIYGWLAVLQQEREFNSNGNIFLENLKQ